MVRANSFARTADGVYLFEGDAPKVVVHATNGGKDADDDGEDDPPRRPLWLTDEYTHWNRAKEFAFHPSKKVQMDLRMPVHTAEDFQNVVHLLAQSESGRMIISSLMHMDEYSGILLKPLSPFHHPEYRLRAEPDPIMYGGLAYPSSRYRTEGRVRLVADLKKINVYFQPGQPIGALLFDLIYAYGFDLTTGWRSTDPEKVFKGNSEFNFVDRRRFALQNYEESLAELKPRQIAERSYLEEMLERELNLISHLRDRFIHRRKFAVARDAHALVRDVYEEIRASLPPLYQERLDLHVLELEAHLNLGGIRNPPTASDLVDEYHLKRKYLVDKRDDEVAGSCAEDLAIHAWTKWVDL